MNTVSLGFKFGGQNYNFSGIDLILDDVSNTPGLTGLCLSSIFVLGSVLETGVLGTNDPAWLVGDAFLKNVYSVYRSVDALLIHVLFVNPCLFKNVPDMRPQGQERSMVRSALLDLAVWTVVSQRTARRCTRLQHLLQASTYQLPPVSPPVSLRSLTQFLLTVLGIRRIITRALLDCTRGAPSTVPLSLVFRFCSYWYNELGSYVERLYVLPYALFHADSPTGRSADVF